MVILVDTNILVDAIANREPYAEYAKKIMDDNFSPELIYRIFNFGEKFFPYSTAAILHPVFKMGKVA